MDARIKKTTLIDEGAMWRATHRTRGEHLGFLLRSGGKMHRLGHQPAFDALTEGSKSHDWAPKITAPLATMCGLSGFELGDLVPAYADPTCQACFTRDPLAKK
jgi:hypothetical protein